MRKFTAMLAMILSGAGFIAASASYDIANRGTWPESWPKELDHLRKQSRTITSSLIIRSRYEIPFSKREDFESAWPYILRVKSRGAPLILLSGPREEFGAPIKAGVRIWCPPPLREGAVAPSAPMHNEPKVRSRWLWTTFVELVIDGEVVNLNRISLPADTMIIDERFKQGDNQ